MSSLVLKQLPLLELLTKVNGKSRKKILKCCSLELIEAIAECIFNVLQKNIRLEKSRIKKLRKHKTTLRRLVKPEHMLSKKRNEIIQSGGSFLPLILAPVVSYLFEKIMP